ncbi:VENN motif pre-toxin domain-containing protein, partial [Faucicola atlantae]|uniref:VENN motif pre-toxin domain-containing protein n=1 Tax=Faucicola atlantae TaxID=34059 RepID=UPI000AB6256D
LSADEKATVSSITSLGGLDVGATTGDVGSAVNSAETGKVAVEDNATYINEKGEILSVVKNNDLNIYQFYCINNICPSKPRIAGYTLFNDAFISPDSGKPVGKVNLNQSIDKYLYNLNSKANGESSLIVAYKSLPYKKYVYSMGDYDIKRAYKNGEIASYEGYLFNGSYVTLREAGNILAGMNAASLGIPFEEFQKNSGALQDGIGSLIWYKITNKPDGSAPQYGENNYQYLRSKYGYDLIRKQKDIQQQYQNMIDFSKLPN